MSPVAGAVVGWFIGTWWDVPSLLGYSWTWTDVTKSAAGLMAAIATVLMAGFVHFLFNFVRAPYRQRDELIRRFTSSADDLDALSEAIERIPLDERGYSGTVRYVLLSCADDLALGLPADSMFQARMNRRQQEIQPGTKVKPQSGLFLTSRLLQLGILEQFYQRRGNDRQDLKVYRLTSVGQRAVDYLRAKESPTTQSSSDDITVSVQSAAFFATNAEGTMKRSLQNKPTFDAQEELGIDISAQYTSRHTHTAESITLVIEGATVPNSDQNWYSQRLFGHDSLDGFFVLPRSISPGPHQIRLSVNSADRSWHSEPFSIVVPKVSR